MIYQYKRIQFKERTLLKLRWKIHLEIRLSRERVQTTVLDKDRYSGY